MIKSVKKFITRIQEDLSIWNQDCKPWFRGESGNHLPLCPKIAKYSAQEENYLLQSFRRQAGGLSNVPPRQGHTDMWLFFAQHYGLPTRLLDWTEGALHALYFAINCKNSNPRVYMLNPHQLNTFAGINLSPPNYPLSWVNTGALYVALAWEQRKKKSLPGAKNILNLNIPIAFPATYQDHRMIAQRSCFTIHGTSLEPLLEILLNNDFDVTKCLIEYKIDIESVKPMLSELSILGVSAATIFPDLDHLAQDLVRDLKSD